MTKDQHAVKIGEIVGDLNLAIKAAKADNHKVKLTVVKSILSGSSRLNFEVK